jgi:hypothetical protein
MRAKQFGQRTEGTTREGLRNIQGVHFERTDDGESNEGASKLRKMVFWIGAAALMIGIYVGTRGSGQDLGQFWKKNSGTVVDDIYAPIGAKDVLLDQANKTCKSRGDAAGASPVQKTSAYVACLAAENPKRLCQATHRTHFIAAMRGYYRSQAQSRETTIRTDPQVAEALKAVIVNGHIPRRDIIAAGPSDLEIALRGVEAKRNGC